MKKLKLAFFTILTLGLVSFAFIPKAKYSPVFAEGEEITSSQPVETSSSTNEETPEEEEAAKWKELYEKAQGKLTEMSNYQVLGITTATNGSVLLVYDDNYTDATTFKNAMKGVLLAYEKASS